MAIKAIFFDLDDTLHDHLFPFLNAIQTTFPRLAEQVDIESVYKRFRDYSDLLWKDYSRNEITLEELRLNRIILAFEEFNLPINLLSASEFQKNYDSSLKRVHLFPEVPELLKSLTKMGCEIGILTNGPVEHQLNKINFLGLTSFIPRERIFISDEVGIAKPNPQVFHYVAEKVNRIPGELVYVGDSWPNDVVAPMEAGWKSIWYNHRKRQASTAHKPAGEIDHLPLVLHTLHNLKE